MIVFMWSRQRNRFGADANNRRRFAGDDAFSQRGGGENEIVSAVSRWHSRRWIQKPGRDFIWPDGCLSEDWIEKCSSSKGYFGAEDRLDIGDFVGRELACHRNARALRRAKRSRPRRNTMAANGPGLGKNR
jgi:hypothetical protein